MQRLRKRIANENRGGSGGSGGEGSGEEGASSSTISRVPSFYTSRSIVNLSGLSVSDPAPIADGSSYRDDRLATVLAHQQQQKQQYGEERGREVSSTRQEHQQAAANFAEVFNQSPETVGVQHADIDTDTDAAVLKDREVHSPIDQNDNDDDNDKNNMIASTSQRNKSANNLLSEHNDTEKDINNQNATKQRRHSGTFEDSSLGPKVVEKTTNMANFYYRQAQSPSDKANNNMK